jgi:hypothetical protein
VCVFGVFRVYPRRAYVSSDVHWFLCGVFGVFGFGLKKELILSSERKTNNRGIISIGRSSGMPITHSTAGYSR